MLSALLTMKWKVDWISRRFADGAVADQGRHALELAMEQEDERFPGQRARLPRDGQDLLGLGQGAAQRLLAEHRRPARSARIVHSACSELGSAM